ncbi:CHASE2 domain-containing protein [candidate division KSB1 bacterium]
MPEKKEAGKLKKTVFQFSIGLFVGIIVILFSMTGLYEILEFKLIDERFKIRGSIYMDPVISTIDIDAYTLGTEGRIQDWTRDKHFKIIKMVKEMGARMIGFDYYFVEESSQVLAIEEVEGKDVKGKEEFLSLFHDYDREMYETIKEAGNVILGQTLNDNEPPKPELIPEALNRLSDFYIEYPDWDKYDFQILANIEHPLLDFIEAAKGVGLAETFADPDGSVRRYPLFKVYDGKLFPALALIMLCDYIGVSPKDIKVYPGKMMQLPPGRLPDGTPVEIKIPIDNRGMMMVNWAGSYWDDNFQHLPHLSISTYYKRRQVDVIAKAIKKIFYNTPDAVNDTDVLVQELKKVGLEVTDEVIEIYDLLFNSVLIEQEAINKGEVLTKDDVPPDIYNIYLDVLTNHKMYALLKENPDITPEEAKEKVGIEDAGKVSLCYKYIKHKLATEAITEQDYPLYFFPIEIEGKLLTDDVFKDKVFFYGLTAAGTWDLNPMPYLDRYPMLGLHANAFNTILTQNFLRQLPRWLVFTIILLSGLLMGLIVPKLGPIKGAIVILALLAGYLITAQYVFVSQGLIIDVLGTVGTLGIGYLSITVYNFFSEEKEKKMIRGIFSRYVTKSVVDELIKNPDMVKLGGERKTLTVFFSDVAGFTTVSETLSPEELVALLNEYLTAMSNIILKYDGMIDKYEGDAIMAVFGTPVPIPDHAVRACYVSLEMQDELVVLRKKWHEEGKPELKVRIGLNTGPMIAGNMGAMDRLDYTVMGDSVNLGSRLEGANKQYGTYIMISEFTYELVKNDMETRFLDSLRVKGKKLPVKVYEILTSKNKGLSDIRKKVIESFDQGMECYLKQDWDKGISYFENALSLDNEDPPSQVYLERCQVYKENPPASDWDGVYTMTTK